MVETIVTDNAPAAIGPYSQAIKFDKMIFASGQIPIDPKTSNIVGDTIEEQTDRVCKNIIALLEAAGTSIDKVIKTTCYMENIDDFAAFNKVYENYFLSKPARSCVSVKAIPKGAKIEIEVIAII